MAQKYPFPLNVIRTVFPTLEKLFPNYAVNLATKLFLTPVRFGFTQKEKEFLPQLQQEFIHVNGKKIMTYSLGEGPEILCIHGWSGRALQFRMFAEAIASNGYKFVAFDALGHGQSEGKMSSLFEFAEGLKAVIANQKNLKAVIAHSLGSATSSYYASSIGELPALITLGAPVVAEDILSSFSETINASKSIHSGIRKKAVERYQKTFDEVAMENTFKGVKCPVLALHGIDDKDVPHTHLDVLVSINPSIDHKKYEGIGHRRILKDEMVIRDAIEWIKAL